MSPFQQGSNPLPPNDYNIGTATYTAYDHCLWLEHFASWDVLVDELQPEQPVDEELTTDMPPAIVARVPGYAIRFAPNDMARDALVQDTLVYEKDSDPALLAGLAHLYLYGLCRVFYGTKSPTPDLSAAHTPRLSSGVIANDPTILSSSPSDTARLRIQTLLRDRNRCVFTGHMDTHQRLKHLQATGERLPGQGAPTNLAHIIRQSLSDNTAGASPAAVTKFLVPMGQDAGNAAGHFGGFKAEEFGLEVLQSPVNAFTASGPPHQFFNELRLWLTPDGETTPNTYEVGHRHGIDNEIPGGFKSHATFNAYDVDGIVIPAPDPGLVALHAACARTVNTSGAADYIEERYRDTEPIAVMTEPNAAYKLTRALTATQMASGGRA